MQLWTWWHSRLRALQRGDTFIRLTPNPGFSLDFGLFHLYWSTFRGWHPGWGPRPAGYVHQVRHRVGR